MSNNPPQFPLPTSETKSQTQREYEAEDEHGAHFWPWLEEQVAPEQYAAMRKLPLPMVRQMHKTDWGVYVQEHVFERMRQSMVQSLERLVLNQKSIIFDEAWDMRDGRS